MSGPESLLVMSSHLSSAANALVGADPQPQIQDRESYKLLNLTESDSDSDHDLPDLNLIAPVPAASNGPAQRIKKKIRLKRQERKKEKYPIIDPCPRTYLIYCMFFHLPGVNATRVVPDSL